MSPFIFSLAVIGGMLLSIPSHAETKGTQTLGKWKTECVGRYQIEIPGEVETILPTPYIFLTASSDHMIARYLFKSTLSFYVYNENPDRFSHFMYSGEIGITPEVPQIDFDNLKKYFQDRKQGYLDEALKFDKSRGENNYISKEKREAASHIRAMDYDAPNMFGWGVDSGSQFYLYQNKRIFIYNNGKGNGQADAEIRTKEFNTVLNGFRPRPLYELSKQQGVCIPHGFIADDGTAPRDIAVTMRLIDHPDIEVGFRDRSYSKSIIHFDKDQYALTFGPHDVIDIDENEPKNAINDLFTVVTYADEKVKASFMGLHSAHMGGQKGGAIFVTITRADGSLDYGYVVAVKGDDTPKTDTPSQLLYVIRTASRAKGKPVSKDELKAMAEKMVASVKRHSEQ